MSYLFSHTVLFNGEWSAVLIGSIIVLAGVAVYCIRKELNLKKQKEDLEKAVNTGEMARKAASAADSIIGKIK